MTMSTYNPADFPDGKGPRPPEPIDDLYDVVHTETVTVTQRAIDQAAADFTRLEQDKRGLTRP